MTNINLSQSAKNRILEIRNQADNSKKFLRLSVKGGGCSGFQYIFELDEKNLEDDLIICSNGDDVIAKTDSISQQFIDGSTIDFVEELGASYFKVNNPNASANCGCGASFSV
ncbi:MAG: iron-sulfur cluster assembly accessory protein [Proteobacteria bacterium]|nr:iron-sulfur cluster assembly accessory protein [Pseudomonadota bacterium]NCA28014.1 iron-sulfur cluster assembly accessory protein [Pseudomonadota bacterium]